MRVFRYSGFLTTGQKTGGLVVAEDRQTARRILERRGIYVSSLRPVPSFFVRFLPLSYKALAVFFDGLAKLTRAGISPQVAVDELAKEQYNPRIARGLYFIRDALAQGRSLSEAFRASGLFSEDVVAMIQVGEESAKLPEVFERLSELFKEKEQMKKGLITSLLYPSFLVVATFLALGFIVPRVIRPLEEMTMKVSKTLGASYELPLITRLVLDLYLFFSSWGLLILALGILAVLTGVFLYRRGGTFKKRADELLVRIPLVGGLFHRLFLYKTFFSLYLLYGAGVPLAEAFRMLRDLQSVEVYREDLSEVYEKLREGEDFARSLSVSKQIPQTYKILVKSGARSGQLLSTLEDVSTIAREDYRAYAEFVRSTLTPMVVAIAGAVIGLVVVAVYSPIFKMVELLKGGG